MEKQLKDSSVKIISFRVDKEHKLMGKTIIEILGLGDDNKMYYWDYDSGEWYQFWSPMAGTVTVK